MSVVRRIEVRNAPYKHLFISIIIVIIIIIIIITKTVIHLSIGESGGYLPRRGGSANIHHYSPPLQWIIVNYINNNDIIIIMREWKAFDIFDN